MAIENELTLGDYLSTFKRRWKQILITFILLMVAIVTTAFLLPPVYKAQGTISVEAQTVSKDVVDAAATANYVDERIDKITQRVLSKDNLLRLNQKYSLFPNADRKKLYSLVKEAITIETQTKDKSSSPWDSEKVTVALVVGFEYSKPDVTFKVANELVTSFLDENVKARTKRATETTSFLAEELSRLKTDLENVENKVAAYKQKYANSLPEHQEMHMGMLERVDLDIKELDREYKTTQEELRYLDVELATTKAALRRGATSEAGVIGVSELDQARAELDRSLILYKETHPTIRALKRKIALLEKAELMPEDAKLAKTDPTVELAIAKIQAQIEAAKARLVSLADQKKSMQRKMVQIQSQVVQIPQVERGLFTLLRDYENAKAKYEDVKSKQINAKIAENLELGNKGERFALLESPEFPEKKIKPEKKKIIGFGFFGALAAALALAILLDMLDGRIRGVSHMTSVINMRPLVIIPYISTQEELRQNKSLIRYAYATAVALAGLVIMAALYYSFTLHSA